MNLVFQKFLSPIHCSYFAVIESETKFLFVTTLTTKDAIQISPSGDLTDSLTTRFLFQNKNLSDSSRTTTGSGEYWEHSASVEFSLKISLVYKVRHLIF